VLPTGDSPLFPYEFGLHYHDNGDLKKLPEDAGAGSATAIDTHVFFTAGRASKGWRWVAAEGVTTLATGSAVASANELARGVGALVDGRLIMTAADKSAQEDARLLSWSGAGPASVGLTGTTSIDLQREANGQLSLAFDYKASSAPTANMTLQMDCGAGCRGGVPITREVAATAPGQWGHLKMPLACFARAGADMSHVTTPFALETTGKLALTIANIHLESGTDGVASCADGPAFK
jgi:beta-glucosidase